MEEFRRLYETVYQDLYRLAYYYLGNAADAEDAVQDTALAAWRSFGSLKRKEAFRAWILQILVNTCRRALRKRAAAGYGVLSPDPAAELDAQRAGASKEGERQGDFPPFFRQLPRIFSSPCNIYAPVRLLCYRNAFQGNAEKIEGSLPKGAVICI